MPLKKRKNIMKRKLKHTYKENDIQRSSKFSFTKRKREIVNNFQFNSPTSIVMFAPPDSGKSTLTKKILENSNEMFTTPPKFAVYCYNKYLPMIEEINTSFKIIPHEGLPTEEDMRDWVTGDHFIVILDDLQQACERNREAAEMFTVGCRHQNFTVIYICHSIFERGKFSRTINLNCHYIILFRNNRHPQQVQTLGRQIFAKKNEYFMKAFQQAINEDYGYLLINNHPRVRDDSMRLWTKILPSDDTVIYKPSIASHVS